MGVSFINWIFLSSQGDVYFNYLFRDEMPWWYFFNPMNYFSSHEMLQWRWNWEFKIVQLDRWVLSYFMGIYRYTVCVMVCVCTLVWIPLVSEFWLMFTVFIWRFGKIWETIPWSLSFGHRDLSLKWSSCPHGITEGVSGRSPGICKSHDEYVAVSQVVSDLFFRFVVV